jgi:flagellar biosynthesis chaperone FliJ
MEGPVKGKQAMVYCAIALPLTIGSIGCKDDSAAISALEELTGQLSETVAEQNEELSNVAETLQTCMKDLAKAKGEAVVVSTTEATMEAPSLEGEANLTSLEAFKGALNETIEKQEKALSDLQSKVEQCQEDLEAAREEAAAAKKAAAEEAKKKAAPRKTRTEKPTMVKEREAEGRPTTGTGSRYEKRQ